MGKYRWYFCGPHDGTSWSVFFELQTHIQECRRGCKKKLCAKGRKLDADFEKKRDREEAADRLRREQRGRLPDGDPRR